MVHPFLNIIPARRFLSTLYKCQQTVIMQNVAPHPLFAAAQTIKRISQVWHARPPIHWKIQSSDLKCHPYQGRHYHRSFESSPAQYLPQQICQKLVFSSAGIYDLSCFACHSMQATRTCKSLRLALTNVGYSKLPPGERRWLAREAVVAALRLKSFEHRWRVESRLRGGMSQGGRRTKIDIYGVGGCAYETGLEGTVLTLVG